MTRAVQMIGWWCVPALWALNTQLGQTLPYVDCVTQKSWSGLVSFAIVAIASTIAVTGAFATRGRVAMDRFFTLSGCLITSIFGFAALMQGLASMMIDPCAR